MNKEIQAAILRACARFIRKNLDPVKKDLEGLAKALQDAEKKNAVLEYRMNAIEFGKQIGRSPESK